MMANGLTSRNVLCEAAPLYAPQAVGMGGGGSPFKNWIDTAGWPEPVKANVQY